MIALLAIAMTPIFGNYHGYDDDDSLLALVLTIRLRYYTKRPFLRDPRLALLPTLFFVDKSVLDVGCNEGWVTCEIGTFILICPIFRTHPLASSLVGRTPRPRRRH